MPEARRLEALAERMRAVEPVAPSPGAKIRGWNLVLAAVAHSATRRPRISVTRLVLAAAAAGVLLVAGALAASADSLPDSALYPLKGVLEHARGTFAFSPTDQLTYHLELSQTRLAEAEAMIARHRLDLAGRALDGLDNELEDAAQLVQTAKQNDAAAAADMENRLQQAIATHELQLAGLQAQVTNPTALSAISRARDRAAAALQTAEKAGPNGKNGNPSQSPAGGKGNGPATSAHPTPKH
ncbi:MAG: hypothetical protein E6I74_04425 [Chloroflexi bacterium]|nr:MAG: hypothetical protein E6I74_04425 [Chloroflexota bacterium]